MIKLFVSDVVIRTFVLVGSYQAGFIYGRSKADKIFLSIHYASPVHRLSFLLFSITLEGVMQRVRFNKKDLPSLQNSRRTRIYKHLECLNDGCSGPSLTVCRRTVCGGEEWTTRLSGSTALDPNLFESVTHFRCL